MTTNTTRRALLAGAGAAVTPPPRESLGSEMEGAINDAMCGVTILRILGRARGECSTTPDDDGCHLEWLAERIQADLVRASDAAGRFDRATQPPPTAAQRRRGEAAVASLMRHREARAREELAWIAEHPTPTDAIAASIA